VNKFKETDIKLINENFVKLIGNDYALITVKDGDKVNAMTASWGFFGVIWNKNAINLVVRPSRYTYELLKKNPKFTLNFLADGNKDILTFCGTKSGRDYDKIKETGLTPIEFDKNLFGFSQSKYVFVCKKLYIQDMKADCFEDSDFATKMYPNGDVHTMFIAEIEKDYTNIE